MTYGPRHYAVRVEPRFTISFTVHRVVECDVSAAVDGVVFFTWPTGQLDEVGVAIVHKELSP